MRVSIAIAGALLVATSGLMAQSYEVVSIRHAPGAFLLNNRYERPGEYRLEKASIAVLVGQAYGIGSANIEGLPKWASTEAYDIVAKAAAGRTTLDDRRAMKQALLADRFKLRAHYETRDREAFDLVKARQDGQLGPGLVRYDKDCVALANASREARANGDPEPDAGEISCTAATMRTGITGTMPMFLLAGMLTSVAGRDVVDKTGLEGTYRVTLTFDQVGAVRADAPPSELPSVQDALLQQLGLKLQPSRTQVQVLVVDAIERPTEN